MSRIRFHGRGGQGMKTASRIAGTAAFWEWRYAQDSPLYGAERLGDTVDLARKFEKAKQFKGLKLFLTFTPCPTGWLYDPAQTQEYTRLAVDCGVFPLKEAVHSEVTHTYVKQHWRPVEE